ncbi:MAG: pilin [Candidatus Thiodiazotropha sp. (ex Ctena orbiculata)]|nr:pilin [Candidatus Thiodiazotropha taylori]
MRLSTRPLKIVLLSLILLISGSPALAKKFYKCTNAEGELVYQQVACDSNISQETVNVFTPPKHRSQLGSKLMGEGEYIPQGNEPAVAGTMMFQTRLTNVIALLTPIKMQMQQFYMMNGQWPEQPQDLGLNQENLKSADIKEVLFGDQGAIVATLNEHFGSDKRVVLAPQLVMDGTTMEWQCMANFPAQSMMTMGMKMCESRNIR